VVAENIRKNCAAQKLAKSSKVVERGDVDDQGGKSYNVNLQRVQKDAPSCDQISGTGKKRKNIL
jgi:hypothetical protein